MINPAQTEFERLLTRTPRVDRAIDRLGSVLQGTIRDVFFSRGEPGIRLRNFLNGVWLGHPLHAALTDLPVGAWTSGILFDYVGSITGSGTFRRAGDLLTGVGIVGAVGASMAGLADYSELPEEERRFGTVHALLNGASLLAYIASLVQRLSGNRGAAVSLATLGYLGIFLSSDIGGTMVYRYGTMVNREAFHRGPRDFTPVLRADELADGQMKVADVEGTKVLLARVNGQIYAIGDICTHEGCSLAEGELIDTSVKCQCHGSRFSLDDGNVLYGPAAYPELAFDVRTTNNVIEVRRRPY